MQKKTETGEEKKYMYLYRRLKREITEGIRPYGSKMPSKRMISEQSGISVITVEHAYSLLCEEGYTEARERSGYYVIYRDGDFLSTTGRVGESGEEYPALPILSAVHSAPDESISFPVMARAIRKVLLDKGEQILVKSPNHGCPELRGAVAGYLARTQEMYVKPEQVIIGSGAEYLYSLIAQLFKDRVFAIENPSYDKIRRVYRAGGIRLCLLKMGMDGICSEELKNTNATVLHVTPFHSYPSGVTATASKRREYLCFAKARKGYIIEDNFDSELTVSAKNESALFSLCDQGRVVYLNTFSKTVAPSIRVGYMVLPPELITPFEEKLGFYSCTVPVLEQYLLAELINSGSYERHINRIRRERRKKGERQ